MTDSILSILKTYLQGYSELKENAPIWVDFLGDTPTQYSIVPLPGARIIEQYVDDSTLREFPFAFQSMEYTADETERIATSEFYEAFADWLEEQSKNETLPTMNTNQEPVSIEAVSWAYWLEKGKSDTGIYQINCKLTYGQGA